MPIHSFNSLSHLDTSKKRYFCTLIMRKSLILSLFFIGFINGFLFAQEANKELSKSKTRPIKKDNFLMDVSFENVTNAPNDVNFKFGYGNNIQLFYDHQFKAKLLSGALGIGYSHAKYFNNGFITNTDTVSGADYSTFQTISSINPDSSYKRNSYTTNYFDLPFELRFRSTPNEKGHSWKASVGFKVGFRIGSYATTRTDNGRFSDFIQPNLTKTRYGITARFGYGRVGLMGYCGLTQLFEANKGHEMIPYSIGFTISPF